MVNFAFQGYAKTFIPLKNSKNSLKENIIKNKTIWGVS